MSAERLLSAFLQAGMLGVRRVGKTQESLARELWATVAEPEAGAWNRPLAQRSDLVRNYFVDLALDCSAVARTLAQELQPGAKAGTAGPVVQEVDGHTVVLPARIAEASQGSAIYAVDAATAETVLKDHNLPFKPVTVAGGAALLSLFMVDYRQSDLGAYAEFGAAIIGQPIGDELAPPGMVIFALPVSEAFSRDCGREIWGYPKVLAPELVVRREGPRGVCRMNPDERGALSFSVSRRGFGRSREVPLVTYTAKEAMPTRVLFERSGAHERMRSGGPVTLRLGGASGRCECGLAQAQPTTGCVCATLRRFGLPESRPVASGWTEIMTGSFGVPEPLPPPPTPAPVQSPVPPAKPQVGDDA